METITFGQEVYAYICTLVPPWRVASEAWNLGDNTYLTGLEVFRNFGGGAVVIAVDSADDADLDKLKKLTADDRVRLARYPLEVVVVYDDNKVDVKALGIGDSLPGIPWSSRSLLADYVIRDAPR